MAAYLAAVQAARAAYGPLVTADQCAAICWTVAQAIRAGGEDVGLIAKPPDKNHGVVGGLRVAVDCVMWRDGRHVDILYSAGDRETPGIAAPQWLEQGLTDPALFVLPPPGAETPPPDREDPPPGPPPDADPVLLALAGLHRAILDLDREIAEQRRTLTAMTLQQGDDQAALLAALARGGWPATLRGSWIGTLTGRVGTP